MEHENPFNPTREKKRYLLFREVSEGVQADKPVDVYRLAEVLCKRGAFSANPRDLQMALGSLISRTNGQLRAMYLPTIIPGYEAYTYVFSR